VRAVAELRGGDPRLAGRGARAGGLAAVHAAAAVRHRRLAAGTAGAGARAAARRGPEVAGGVAVAKPTQSRSTFDRFRTNGRASLGMGYCRDILCRRLDQAAGMGPVEHRLRNSAGLG
jgi:hypothetical protein